MTMSKFVVGTDGSEHAAVAMRWAVEEAEVHGADVEIVLAWSFLDQHHADRSDRFDPHYTDESARAALAAWVGEAIGDQHPVGQRVVNDLPVRALLEAGDAADLLVLGARGKGGFEGLLLGSVSERVAQLATRPVAVVRQEAPVRGGRVVVGVDGSARSVHALRWAAAEARARSAEVDVVHAWRLPVATTAMMGFAVGINEMEEAGRSVLDSALADPSLAGVKAHAHLTHDSPARALIERAEGAGLLVAGTRGHGRVSGALMGSVSRQLLHHAPVPVVVV